MIEHFFNFLAEIIKCYFDHPPPKLPDNHCFSWYLNPEIIKCYFDHPPSPPENCPIITVSLDIKIPKVNFSLKTLRYNIEHVFDFLGQKLEFWPIINVDLDIIVTLLGTDIISTTFSTFRPKIGVLADNQCWSWYQSPESQIFSQNALIIPSRFSTFTPDSQFSLKTRI